MTTLKAGDILQKGDQQRKSEMGPKPGHYTCAGRYSPGTSTPLKGPGPWKPVTSRVGLQILRSDLMHLNFQRP